MSGIFGVSSTNSSAGTGIYRDAALAAAGFDHGLEVE